MTLQKFAIIAAVICFGLAALPFIIVVTSVNLALAGMAFFALSFYPKS